MAAVAKSSSPVQPFVVGNELVCNMIAQIMLLPCPPGALLEHSGQTYYCSLNFNLAGHALPPAPAAIIVATLPELAWGIIIFDVLMMKADRHAQNIAFDRTTKELIIFDHSHAFLTPNGNVQARLQAAKNLPSIGGHCLATEINTWSGFRTWTARVKAIPDRYLEGAIDAGCDVGLPAPEKKLIYDFMRARRDTIDATITNNRGVFPKLPAGAP